MHVSAYLKRLARAGADWRGELSYHLREEKLFRRSLGKMGLACNVLASTHTFII